jgi:hypothetical protein
LVVIAWSDGFVVWAVGVAFINSADNFAAASEARFAAFDAFFVAFDVA